MDTLAAPNPVTGQPLLLLRLEGLATLAAAAVAYEFAGGAWPVFALLFLLPDLAMAGYLAGPRAGAVAYNLAHSYFGPALLGGAGLATGNDTAIAAALVWVAHIGFDRALGYGLKYPTGFTATHLGAIGAARGAPRA